MKQPFLDKLADEVVSTYKSNMQELCFVFPSKRAGIFFKKFLSQKLTKPVWAPDIFSIEEFIQKLSPYRPADKLVLIFELFETYKHHGEDQSFDMFYPWGEMMLKDFDEIDKNLVSGKDIFKIVRELREVEEELNFNIDDIEQFSSFWKTFSNRDLSSIQNEFIKTWQVLGKVYDDFRKRLAEKNIAYDGMAFRKLYEEIKKGSFTIPWGKIIFAGFHLLTKSEEGIIKELLRKGKAEIYWDADEYYINDSRQEAGELLRKNFKNLKIDSPKWIGKSLTADKKSVKITGAPLLAGQAKALGNELKKILSNNNSSFENTAIVLPDESLLIPVLNSLPAEIDSLNVTMGFPLKSSSLYNLFQILKKLQKNKKSGKNCVVFYHKDVMQLLLHPYVKFNDPVYIYDTVNDIKKNNIIYVSKNRIENEDKTHPEILDILFKDVSTAEEIQNYLYEIISYISGKFERSGSAITKFELEFFYALFEQLNRLKDIISSYSGVMTGETYWRLLDEVLRTSRIPLTGEPLKGVQVMGLLETRALDFENVFILSLNEGIMPRGVVQNSFIPYNIRKAFRLPTYDEEDSLPAYYFYRLLTGAKSVHLFYNTEVDVFASGEISRFLLQVEDELAKYENINCTHTIISTEIEKPFRKEISVAKTPGIIEKLSGISYSPSDLNNYISCKLKFYMKKIARLDEEEEIEEFFGPATFGSILHNIAEIIYKEHEGKTFTKEIIESIREKLNNNYDSVLKQAFEKINSLKELDTDLQGKNLLLKNIIRTLVNKILDSDLTNLPFKILNLELKIEDIININQNGKAIPIGLRGRIDRVEEKDGIPTIIDYKTGIFKPKNDSNASSDEYFDTIISDPEYKEYFQAYFYAYSYFKSDGRKKIKIAIYPVKKISEGLAYLTEEPVTEENIAGFEKKLMKLFEELLNAEIPFFQTEDIKRCRFCAYKSICYREQNYG